MSAELPADAITAAAIAVHKRRCNCAIPHREGWPGYSRLEYEYAEHALTAALPALTGAIAARAAAAERERFLSVLAEHYLMMVICDEEAKRDNPVCGCSRVFLGWHPSIGEARQAWIDHVAGLLAGTAGGAVTDGGTT